MSEALTGVDASRTSLLSIAVLAAGMGIGSLLLGSVLTLLAWRQRRSRAPALSAYDLFVAERLAEIQAREVHSIAVAEERYQARVRAERAYRDTRSRFFRLA